MSARSQVISIFSGKGGVGNTFVTVNLAATLKLHARLKTTLLELDSSQADARRMLGEVDVAYVSERLTAESLPSMIEALRRSADMIIIDAGSVVNRLAVAAFEQSNLILLLTTPDAMCIRHTQEALEQFAALKLPLRMVGIVINRAESRGSLRSIEVRTQFAPPVLGEIPSDGRLAGVSVNQGIPVVTFEENSRIKEAFKRFARFLLDNPSLFVERVQLDRLQLANVLALNASQEPALALDGRVARSERLDPLLELKSRVHNKMIERFDLKRIDLRAIDDPAKASQLRERVKRIALELVTEEAGIVPGLVEREQLVKEIVDEVLGLGPLEDLIADRDISDILVNGKDAIYIERRGKLSLTDKRFLSNEQVLVIIERIIAPLGRRIDESSPMVDARLPDGSRVNAIIPPLSITGPMLSIRKFNRQRYTMDDLIRLGTLSAEMASFLSVCAKVRKNIIVSGGTGSGKTTLLNALSAFVPDDERIITIEDSAELRLSQAHWIPLEARPPNIEGRGAISVRQLFRNTLRMRPDRVIIGECRGDETLDMLQAMNTGHDGSMTTLHANSPSDVVPRLDSLVLMSYVDLPIRAIREQIASAIHLIVHIARLSDGSRKITYITEVTGLNEQADVTLKDLFVFRQQGVGPHGEVVGLFQSTGHVPTFLEELRTKGFNFDERMFQRDQSHTARPPG